MVALLLPLLTALALSASFRPGERRALAVILVLVLGVLPYLLRLRPAGRSEYWAGLFSSLMTLVLLLVLYRAGSSPALELPAEGTKLPGEKLVTARAE